MSSQKKQKNNNKIKQQQQHKNKQKGYRSSCLECEPSLDVHIPEEQVILLVSVNDTTYCLEATVL